MKIGSAKKKNSLSDKPRKTIFKLLVKEEQDVVRDNAIRVNSPETEEASSEPSINQSKATISLSPIPSSAVEENITHQERFENASSVDLDGLSSRGDKAQGGVHETLRQSQASLANRTLKEGGVQLRDWLWTLKAPLFLLGAIALVPKIVLGWVLVILVKPVTSWIYNYCPKSWKATFHRSIPERFRNSPFLQDLSEGADQGLPFILFWLYIFCIPFAACWIVVHWIKGFLPERPRTFEDSNEKIVFAQNRSSDRSSSENNFYFSRVFGIVFLAFFALGIPAFCSFAVYENLGIEKKIKSHQVSPVVSRLMRTKNAPPASKPTLGIATRLAIQKKNNDQSTKFGTAVTGYHSNRLPLQSLGIEQNKESTFFIHFYLASLACAVCILFFRTWFLFPLNFLTDEHDLEITTYGIKKKAFKGWFLSFLTFNKFSIAGGPDSLKWDRIKSVAPLQEGCVRLHPLPETAFSKSSLIYKLLNKVAAFIDGMSARVNCDNYLVFSTTEDGVDYGCNIKISLKELNREQRARLFYSVKHWAPHVAINKSAEEQLLGSSVLQDARYTQLWFDLLTSKNRVRRQMLTPGEVLKDGEYTINDRLSSGGQASAYLALRADGSNCVLKEFILATSSTSGAMLESAREFEAEVSLLSQLDHQGIIKLHDFFSEEGRVYVALEYVEGQSLRQKVQAEGALSEAEVIRISRSICEVLKYLHSCNPPIVHRDITPENIMINADGTIKVIDFSLAVRDNGLRATDSCGKQAYTPPEQFQEEVCVQSDIYALGATIYFMLTGTNPKPISSSSPRLKAPHVSPELNSIVERATLLDLTQRYESAYWLNLDLGGLSGGISDGASMLPSIKSL